MSRIGKNPVTIPAGVQVTIDEQCIRATNTKGTLECPRFPGVRAEQTGDTIVFTLDESTNDSRARAFWGLSRALTANIMVGLSEGYKKTLEVLGVGYKFEVASPTKLILSIGFSHKVELAAPKGVIVAADASEKNTIHISGIDKQQVGYFAALVRGLKVPEPYKGKGIRYQGEHVRRKAGKTGGKK